MNNKTNETADLTPTHLVGIGASAGGLESLERLFRPMPTDTGMAFVIIQHLSPDFKSLMGEQLERFTSMPAIPVTDRITVRPNTIYLLPPAMDMVVEGDELISTERPGQKILSLPINSFFRSLASEWGEKAVGVILSGTGSDGAAGVMDVREGGGLVMAQSEESSRFDGMPHSAIATGCVDIVLTPEKIGEALIAYRDNPSKHLVYPEPEEPPQDGIPAIFDALHKVYDIDFNFYKPQTITRRIQRRIALSPEQISVEDYGHRVQEDPDELNLLYKDLLIGVTRFFRDPEAFERLIEEVIPKILLGLDEGEDARVWVCGCSTGEEAYSIAILFLEAFDQLKVKPRLKILATDLHRESLQFAAEGLYPASSFPEMPETLREKYFVPQDGGLFKVTAELRKPLIFSEHNLLKDPPFTRIDLVSCRNLLIYLQNKAQTRAIAFFLFSLKLNGYLLLGSSEGLGELSNQFRTVSQHWKIFTKVRDDHRLASMRSPLVYGRAPGPLRHAPVDRRLGRAYDLLLDRYIPAGVLLNDQKEALHVFGDATRYMKQPAGRVTSEIYSMTEGTLRSAIMSALRNAEQSRGSVTLRGVRCERDEQRIQVDVTVETLMANQPDGPLYILRLEEREPILPPTTEAPSEEPGGPIEIDNLAATQMRHLEQELQQTRESLQSAVEELETSNEELQATNEELLASNEELQSTNEELHSVNEELYSVNAEHEGKILELNTVTSDLNNLIRSTDLATVFIDQSWKIRLFTPKALEIFPLVPSDAGRSLRNFQPLHPDPLLYQDIEQVLKEGVNVRRQLEWDGKQAFLRRVSPYHDIDNRRVIGVSLTYIDISDVVLAQSALQNSEHRLAESDRHLRTAQALAHVGSWAWDLATDALTWSDECFRIFGYQPGEITPTYQLFMRHVAPADTGRIQEAVDATLQRGQPYRLEYWITRADGSARAVLATGDRELDPTGQPIRFTGTVMDVTDIKQTDEELRALNQRLEQANAAKSAFLATMSHEIRTPLNAIVGTAHLMAQRRLDAEQAHDLQTIDAASKNLLALVNDVLDFSRIEAGELTLAPRPFSPAQVVEELRVMFSPTAEAKGVSLTMSRLPEDCPPVLIGDPNRLRQILVNLLTNAIKFTRQGRVECAVRVLGRSPDEHSVHLCLEVRDSGIGISPENLARLFRPFVQVDSGAAREFGGAGLGLSIVKRLAELMGGAVSAESQLGVGSSFRVELPFAIAGEDDPLVPETSPETEQDSDPVGAHQPDQPKILEGLRILVVDDSEINLKVTCRLLELQGAAAKLCATGEEALDALRETPATYDAILMDLQMPGMDGCEASRQIREALKLDNLPILALTAGATTEQQERARQAGMDDFLTKPVDPVQLQRQVRLWVDRYQPDQA